MVELAVHSHRLVVCTDRQASGGKVVSPGRAMDSCAAQGASWPAYRARSASTTVAVAGDQISGAQREMPVCSPVRLVVKWVLSRSPAAAR